MEQASISGVNYRTFPRTVLGLVALIAAVALLIVAFTGLSDAGNTDRVMTDEVKKIKVGYIVSGDPKPRGGLPELSQQISSGDLAAAQKTLGGLNKQLASVTSELTRRGSDLAGVEHFSMQLKEIEASVSAGNQEAAKAAAGAAPGIWAHVESDLSKKHVNSSVLGGSIGLMTTAWLLLTGALIALAEKPRRRSVDGAAGDESISDRLTIRVSDIRAEAASNTNIRGINLMRVRPLRAAIASPAFPAAFQALGLVFLIAVVVVGIAGTAGNSENLSTQLVWSLWWSPVMMLGLVLLGKLWCGACPLGAITAIVERFGAGRRSPVFTRKVSLGLLGATPLAIGIIGFIAMREPLFGSGYAVSQAAPFWTVFYFGIWIVAAIGVSLVYKRRAWCRYWCPVSAATTVTAKLSPLRLAHGRSSGVINCSTTEYPGNYLDSDKRCIYCMKCTQAYPDEPVVAKLQIPGSAAVRDKKIFAEAVISIIIVAVFPIGHGLGQISIFKGETSAELRLSFFAAIVGCLAAYALVSRIGSWLSGESYRDIFARFGIAFVPMGVLFSVGQAVTGVLNKSGNWLNAVAPYLGINGFWNANIVEKGTVTSWQEWSMSWMAAIGGLWALLLIWAIARRHKTSAAAWLPMMALVVVIVMLAKGLPMPMH